MYAFNGAGRGAPFLGDVFTLHVLVRVFEERNAGCASLLRTPANDAGFVESGETLIMMAGRLSGLGLSSSVVVWTIGTEIPRR